MRKRTNRSLLDQLMLVEQLSVDRDKGIFSLNYEKPLSRLDNTTVESTWKPTFTFSLPPTPPPYSIGISPIRVSGTFYI